MFTILISLKGMWRVNQFTILILFQWLSRVNQPISRDSRWVHWGFWFIFGVSSCGCNVQQGNNLMRPGNKMSLVKGVNMLARYLYMNISEEVVGSFFVNCKPCNGSHHLVFLVNSRFCNVCHHLKRPSRKFFCFEQ